MKKISMLSALLALVLLVGCGAEKSPGSAASSSAPESSSAAQSSDPVVDETPVKDACPLDASDWQTLKVEDTKQEPGSAYFTAQVDETFADGLTSLWQAAEWEEMPPLEAGATELFYLEKADGAMLSVSSLSETELMAALKLPDSDQWECWKLTGDAGSYQKLAQECLERQGQ